MQQITLFINLQDQLNMFRQSCAHLQQRKTANVVYSPVYCHVAALLTANPPPQQHTILHALICSLTLLKMGKICPKHFELILEINKMSLNLKL
jgi:hypothetical protein